MARTPLFRAVVKGLFGSIRSDGFWANVKLSRRTGLLYGGVSGIAAYGNACAGRMSSPADISALPSNAKVVIIGGGAAGLSAAYYLKKSGISADLFEANARLGGRIFTQHDFNQERMFCERGGEFIDTGHKEIRDLITDLGLRLESLPDPSRLTDVYYFGRRWRSLDELVEAFKPLAQRIALDAREFVIEGEFTMPTFANPISDRVKNLDAMSLKQYLDSATDSPKWVRELIRVAYVGEYGLEAEQQSAVNLVTFIGTNLTEDGFQLFGESDERYRIEGGNSKLIDRLHEEVSGQVKTHHVLQSIARGSQNRFQLLFHDTRAASAAKVVEVLADYVIITLPYTVLRGISGLAELGIKPRKMEAIRDLGYGSNSKLMLGFKSRYWRKTRGGFPANDGGVVSDLSFQGGWDTSRQQTGQSGIFTNFLGGQYAENFRPIHIKKSLADLSQLYPGIDKEHDGRTVLQVWASVKTAKGSYICQKPGQYTAFGGVLAEAECDGRLIFAGEHTSEVSAGFMNGAVESGLRAASEYLTAQRTLQPDSTR